MTTFTPAQLGAANMPGAHSDRTAPAGQGDVDQRGNEFGFVVDETVGPMPLRGFRANGKVFGGTAQDVASLDTKGDDLAELHHERGSRDKRRTDEQERGNARGEIGHESARELWDNSRRRVEFIPEAPPARARQGWTGEDPARPSMMFRPTMLRPFDKAIAEHPGAVDKIPQPAPRAATSRFAPAIQQPLPSPGGWFATLRAGIGPTRARARIIPTPWADKLVQEPAPAGAPRGFRR